jgi:hypothetical protein
LIVNHDQISDIEDMSRKYKDELIVIISSRDHKLGTFIDTHRFKKRLCSVTENEGETQDDSSERNERFECVVAIEDEQANKHQYDQCDNNKDGVQFRDSGPCIFQTGYKSSTFTIDPLDSLSHFVFSDVPIAVFIKDTESLMSFSGGTEVWIEVYSSNENR